MSKEKPKFDEFEIQRQVFTAMGVGTPELETVPAPKPPFHTVADCCEACLGLPGPLDEAFGAQQEPARVLAVLAAFEMERGSGGLRQALENLDTAYILDVPAALRKVGLPQHAEALEAWLQQALGTLTGDAVLNDEAAEEAFREKLRFAGRWDTDWAADWQMVTGALLSYANAHPEAFGTEEDG